jgi:hypothetical protein
MQSVSRGFILAAFGLMLFACFNTKTKVSPGVTNPQPDYTCQSRGGYCRMNSDCCSQACVDSTCVWQ